MTSLSPFCICGIQISETNSVVYMLPTIFLGTSLLGRQNRCDLRGLGRYPDWVYLLQDWGKRLSVLLEPWNLEQFFSKEPLDWVIRFIKTLEWVKIIPHSHCYSLFVDGDIIS